MAEKVQFNTVEDMVEYVTRHLTVSDKRWMYHDRTEWEWDDPEAGKAWEAQLRVLEYDENGHWMWTNQRTPEQQAAIDAHQNLKPARHKETTYWLEEAGRNYRGTTIWLGKELGAKVFDIWTKKLQYRHQVPVGMMSLQGILKRLGEDKGVAEKIQAAKEVEKLRSQKNARNYHRRQMRDLAQKLITATEKAAKDLPGVNWASVPLHELAALEDEE